MSKSLQINAPQIVQTRNTLNAVPSGSTATPDYSVKYVPQDLTEAQKAQARQNIGVEAGEQVQSNWNETDTESPAYIQNKPTIPAAPVQSNWNETDTASLAYIQNKPTIPASQVQADWNQSDDTAVDYIKNKPTIASIPQFRVRNNTLPGFIPEDNGQAIIVDAEAIEWGTSTEFAANDWYHYYGGALNNATSGKLEAAQGRNIYVRQSSDLAWVKIRFGDKAGNYKIKINQPAFLPPGGSKFFDENTAYTGNIIIMWGNHMTQLYRHETGGIRETLSLPICTSMYTYLMYNRWPKDGSGSRLYGNLVFVDKPFQLAGADNHDASLPDMTNVTAVYVPKARATEFASFMDYGYGSGNWSTIEAKVVYYDFLTWVDDMTPKVVVLPTVPLTMTDENSNVISGNFVAQDVTITPAV